MGHRRRAAAAGVSAASARTRYQRHSRLPDRPPRRRLLADRGVRRRLPDAPAAPGRVLVPLVGDDELLAERTFPELGALQARERLGEIGDANALYSFGIAHPGAITLHNYPRFLQHFDRPDGIRMDLAATDILRIARAGRPALQRVPRALPHEAGRVVRADDDEPGSGRRRFGSVYDGDIERGRPDGRALRGAQPKGFGFSDTAFRVFILMASRRLKSDRFFTRDYTAGGVHAGGIDWVNDSTMVSVLLRHYPSLAPALRGVRNAFAPWARVS